MPTKTFYSKLFLLALILTFASVAAKSFLPQKSLSLIPGDPNKTPYYLSEQADTTGKKAVYWVNYEQPHYRCDYKTNTANQSCALTFSLSQSRIQGINLQQFSGMKIDIKYKGPAKTLRIAMRNFDPRFSTPEDYNSDKFIFVITNAIFFPIKLSRTN